MTGRIHMAGGVWPIGDHRAMPTGAQGITPWEFVANCLDQAAKVFEGHGVTRMQMNDPNGPALAIAYRLGAESREFVALSLWRGSKSAQAVLSAASQPSKRAGMPSGAEAVAGLFANVGMLHLMLSSMSPDGITDSVVEGRRARTQRQGAARSAGDAARRDDWRQEAREAWEKDPRARITTVAKAIAKRHSTATHDVDPSSVRRAIKELVPDTSPSFRGGRADGLSRHADG